MRCGNSVDPTRPDWTQVFVVRINRNPQPQVMSRSLPYKEHDQAEVSCGVMTGLLARPKLTKADGALWPTTLPILMARCLKEGACERPSFEQILDELGAHAIFFYGALEGTDNKWRYASTCNARSVE